MFFYIYLLIIYLLSVYIISLLFVFFCLLNSPFSFTEYSTVTPLICIYSQLHSNHVTALTAVIIIILYFEPKLFLL